MTAYKIALATPMTKTQTRPMNAVKQAFAKRFEQMSADERAVKAARLRELLGQVRGNEHYMRNIAARG
jgi:hypothetical protein